MKWSVDTPQVVYTRRIFAQGRQMNSYPLRMRMELDTLPRVMKYQLGNLGIRIVMGLVKIVILTT